MTMIEKPNYYYLQTGELTREGDECDVEGRFNAPPRWEPTTPAQIAPDPQYPAHRRYRRLIVDDQDRIITCIASMSNNGEAATVVRAGQLRAQGSGEGFIRRARLEYIRWCQEEPK